MHRLPPLALAIALCLAAPACGDAGDDGLADTRAPGDVGDVDASPDLPADVPGELPDLPPEGDTGTDDTGTDDTGTDDTGPDDGHGDTTEPAPDPVWGYAGSIHVVQYMGYGDGAVPQSSALEILFQDAPNGRNHVLEAEDGACRFYRVAPQGTCTPACADDWSEYCSLDGACLPYPQRVSAGTVTVSGVAGGPYVVPVGDQDWYSAPATPAELFDAGAAITVSATGGDVPAFEAHLTGVGSMAAPIEGALTLVDGADQAVTWTPAGDGSTVELVLQIGWHGRPPDAIIWCTAADAQGQVVVPRAMVEAFPAFGGMGLFQHPAFLRRVSRQAVASPGGPIEVLVASQMAFGVIH